MSTAPQPQYPPGWDQQRIQDVIAYYENRSPEQALADYMASEDDPQTTMVEVPNALMPAVRDLVARYQAASAP